MGQINIGISKIEFAEPSVDGTMPVDGNFSAWGYTVEDSATFTSEDGTTTEYNVEELDIPLDSQTNGGKKYFTFTIADPDVDTIKKALGGTINSEGEWEAPNSTEVIEKAFKITPKRGIGFKAALATVRGKFTNGLGKNNYVGIEVTVELKKSSSENEPVFRVFSVD